MRKKDRCNKKTALSLHHCGCVLFMGIASIAHEHTLFAQTLPPLILAEHYVPTLSPTAYLVSEKLDGVRAYWDGTQLTTRAGHRIHAPDWFIQGLPKDTLLDGELWIGHRQFDRVNAIVRAAIADDHAWSQVTYHVFEAPYAWGTFEQRYQSLQQRMKQQDTPWLQVVPQFRVATQAQLDATLQQIVARGGEGLMLHKASSPFKAGRQSDLRKYKLSHDAEATVIAHLPGKGQFEGKTGALRVQTPDGKQFNLGSGLSVAQRTNPPPIGSIVTYRYRDTTSTGLPRFATFVRVHE